MADGVKLIRVKKAELPTNFLDRATWDKVGKVAAAGVIDNIIKQTQADGQALKKNASSTIKRKRKLALPLLSLVFKDRSLVKGAKQSFIWRIGRNSVTIRPATAEAKNRTKWVQQKGFTGWFGISAATKTAIKALIRKSIKKAFSKASG